MVILSARACNQCIGELVNHYGSWGHLGASLGLHKKQLTFWGLQVLFQPFVLTNTKQIHAHTCFQCAETKQLIFLYVGFRSFRKKHDEGNKRSKETHLIKPMIEQPFLGVKPMTFPPNI